MSSRTIVIMALIVSASMLVPLPAIALTGPGDGPVPGPEAPAATADRVVLAELVTAGWCPNCPSADGALLEMEAAYTRGQLVVLAYHRNDQLSSDGGDARQAFYGDPYQPDLFIDGQVEVKGNLGSPTANRAAYEPEVDARLQEPSPLALTVEGWTDTKTGAGTAFVNVTALSDPALADLRLHVVVFEDDFGPWNGGNGVLYHDWVARQLLTGDDGQAISLTEGSQEALAFNYDASTYAQDLDQVGVIAFVQSAGTKEVLQAGYMKEHRAANTVPEFANPSVTPSSGNTSTVFRYEIGYRDDEGDEPVRAQVIIDGNAHDLAWDHDGPLTEWTGFHYETTLPVGDEHTYGFLFSDGTSEFLIPDPSQGTDRFEGPVVVPPTSAPTLTLATLTPSEGDPLTVFTFSVLYTDGEGDAPQLAQVIIDGMAHDMAGDGTDYASGVTFRYYTVLKGGDHEYHIRFGDGVHGARLPSEGNSTVKVRYEVDRILVLSDHARDGQVSEVEEVVLGFDWTDTEEGIPVFFRWWSDVDGELGASDEVTVNLSPGLHTITLTVTDPEGQQHSQSITVLSVAAEPDPVIDEVVATPAVPVEGDVVTIDVRVVNQGDAPTTTLDVELLDPAGDVLAGTTIGDPVEPGGQATAVLEWTATPGTHALTVRAGDATRSLPLLVEENQPPVIDASIGTGGDSFPEGKAIAFTVQVTDVEGDDVAYLWDFGDGSSSQEASPTHKYGKAGTYTVTVTVTDARGGEAAETLEVQVDERASPGLAAFTIVLVVVVSALVATAVRRR